MNILSKYFSELIKSPSKEKDAFDSITAKDKQIVILKTYLKPTLKHYGYFTSGQTWWKDQGEFFIIINLQNYSWNTKNDVSFCFNIGIGLKSRMKDISKKPTHFDLTIPVREGAYLPASREVNTHRNNTGYIIKQSTDIADFIECLKSDFEVEILPKLESLVSIDDCVKYYEQFPFWGNILKEVVNKEK